MASQQNTVQVVIDSLKAAGVTIVFGDSVFNALVDHPEIKVVVCRHEQNAAFIAGAVGKLTDRPGVVIVTSGPGTSNLVTGLVTATDEGSPVVAIAGSVRRVQSARRTHQSLQGVELLRPVTKKVVAALVEDQVAELVADAFRVAATFPRGATAVSLPIDIMSSTSLTAFPALPASTFRPPQLGPAPNALLARTVEMLGRAKFPVLFLGMRASSARVVEAVHALLRQHPIPVIETFQAAGAISRELAHLFYGRVGLFRNQAGDRLLARADLVLAIGYDEAEYDSSQWNPTPGRFDIIHMDYQPANVGPNYEPAVELVGSLVENLRSLTARLADAGVAVARPQDTDDGRHIFEDFHAWESSEKAVGRPAEGPVHPLQFIRTLQDLIAPESVVTCDVGSVYIYMCRYFYSYTPKTFLVSNAQQTLGVALPWAIGASLSQDPPCSKKVVSISGDGGFQFSGQELATAVLQGCKIAHFIWNDSKYNMVEFQEVDKYGRSAGVELGGVDFVKYAEAYGALGLRARTPAELEGVVREALAHDGVCLVDVEIDYSSNHELMQHVIADSVV
ncbi:acetolactate synthase [Gaeumannomyces tritici R3-111a-1]|uniref:Acetolactate synthase n=1 Tax=Gaeumannomyces tritici (strain R3-111a-1) TaxID=644352 RepID=J3NSY4_GAET3|nr:acetolactate synthase [Gaeumannomyces tritici R3-111a-1]EJT79297.1 acetolactate synthase [Gaeumannomyces tritici R3-111a-1]